jgi:DNA primase
VKGGRPYLYGADHLAGQKVLVLAEGEFDTMLLWQKCRGRVDVASLGSCSGTVSETLLWELLVYRQLLVAYDRDEGGESGALKLQALSARLKRIVPPGRRGRDGLPPERRQPCRLDQLPSPAPILRICE